MLELPVGKIFFPLKTPHIILASGSATRKKILADSGIEPRILPVNCPEEKIKKSCSAEKLLPKEISLILAKEKACLAQKILKIEKECDLRKSVIIGSDQILECGGKIYNKPANKEEARHQLLEMRGKRQFLHTAICLLQENSENWTLIESPELKMRNFSKSFLEAFLEFEGDELLFCVGACRIEGPGLQLFESLNGSKETILGLPILPLLNELRKREMIPS